MRPWVHVVGLGAAGSSLIEALARFDRLPGDVFISDPNPDSMREKGYGFWCRTNELGLFKPDYTWQTWSFSSAGERVTHTGQEFRYGYRFGQSIFEDVAATISNHPQIHFVQEAVEHPPNADFVFDSRPVSTARHIVNQAFHGVFIKTCAAHPFKTIHLMEDLSSNQRGVNFRYILPFTDTQLLIEHTEFTAEMPDFNSLKSKVSRWCDTHINGSYEIIRREQANIPMGLEGVESSFGIPIGVRGGRVRDSSGYSYYYAVKDAHRIAHDLVKNGYVTAPKAKYYESWMDAKLLWLIQHKPQELPGIFLSLAREMTNDRFASFMSENTKRDSLRAIMASPKGPFLRSLLGDL